MNVVSYKDLNVKEGWIVNMSDDDVILIVFVAYCTDKPNATLSTDNIKKYFNKRYNRKFKTNSLIDWEYNLTALFNNRVNGMNSRFWFALTNDGLVEIEFNRQSEIVNL